MIGRRHEGGFSLIEVLMAIIILAIGMISIAALFPAGIAQQRRSVDDVMGPIVANNALAVLRNKLRPEDFGFGSGYTIDGDFKWSRPAFFFTDDTGTPDVDETGAISIFDLAGNAATVSEVLPASGLSVDILITQGERYYPMRSQFSTSPFPAKPQYVWDCMFRRFQGRVQVALFVYRVAIPGGGTSTYTVASPLPVSTDDVAFTIPSLPWDADIIEIPSSTGPFQGWQAPRQWLLDQNNNIHRVLAGRRTDGDGPVELVRPIPRLPSAVDDNVFIYYLPGGNVSGVVTTIWYIPPVDASAERLSLTPVYVTVREL